MANGINGPLSNSEQILYNYEQYKDYYTEEAGDELGQDEFLLLMVEQMKSQDIFEPTDNSEYIAQMAQFTSLQEMQNMTYYTNATYASSLVGKTVSIGTIDADTGDVENVIGTVSSIALNGDSFDVIVNDKIYQLKNIMEILAEAPATEGTEGTETETDDEKTPEEIAADHKAAQDFFNSPSSTDSSANTSTSTEPALPEIPGGW